MIILVFLKIEYLFFLMSENVQKELTDYYQLRKGSKQKAALNKRSKVEVINLSSESNQSSSSENLEVESNENSEFESVEENEEFNQTDNLNSLNINPNSDLCSNLTMAKKDLNIFGVIKFIPEFDGTPSKLHQFLECSEIILSDTKDTEHPKFLQIMKKLLVGKAYDETVKHIDYDSWNDLKIDLKNRYTEVRSKLQISQELNTIVQKGDEDVRAFGSKVQGLLSQLNDVCIIEAGVGSEKYVELINAQTALIAFQEGLNNKIRVVVKSANCKTLNESITKAIEEESLIKRHLVIENKSSNLICQFCKKKGHSADRCYQIRSKNTNQRNFPQEKLPNNPDSKESNLSQNKTNNSIVCSYCKKLGHHINNCFSRKNAETRKGQNSKNETESKSALSVVNSQEKNSGNSSGLEPCSLNRAVRAKDL